MMSRTTDDNAVFRFATPEDSAALEGLNPYCHGPTLARKIAAQEVIVAEDAASGQIAGVIRFEFIWTTVPFMSLIYIRPAYRGRGWSRRLLGFLIEHLKRLGHVALLSSSQSDEPQAQAWHRHVGFHDNGVIGNIADEGIDEVVFRIRLEDQSAPM